MSSAALQLNLARRNWDFSEYRELRPATQSSQALFSVFLVSADLTAGLRAGKSPPGVPALPTGSQTLTTWR